MRVKARSVDWSKCPAKIAPFTKKSQTFLTEGREYDVHAVAVFEGFASVLVVNDIRLPSWEAMWLFEQLDWRLSPDWVCKAFSEEPVLVIGPEFVAKDLESYGAMVDLEADQVDRFWKHVDRVAATQKEDE